MAPSVGGTNAHRIDNSGLIEGSELSMIDLICHFCVRKTLNQVIVGVSIKRPVFFLILLWLDDLKDFINQLLSSEHILKHLLNLVLSKRLLFRLVEAYRS